MFKIRKLIPKSEKQSTLYTWTKIQTNKKYIIQLYRLGLALRHLSMSSVNFLLLFFLYLNVRLPAYRSHFIVNCFSSSASPSCMNGSMRRPSPRPCTPTGAGGRPASLMDHNQSQLHYVVVVVNRDEKGYGMKVSGDNPVYVQSVKEGRVPVYILCLKLALFKILIHIHASKIIGTHFWTVTIRRRGYRDHIGIGSVELGKLARHPAEIELNRDQQNECKVQFN